MNGWCKVVLHSFRYYEVATQSLLKVAISTNKALCVEARFCQVESHMVCFIRTLYVTHETNYYVNHCVLIVLFFIDYF